MDFILDFLSEPSIIAGLTALIGLLALRKSFSNILKGTLKTTIGFMILGAGAGVIVDSLGIMGNMLEQGFNVTGVIPNNEAIVAVAQSTLGRETAMIMAFGLVANIAIARVTKLKYIFLTGHHTFFMACLLAAVLGVAGFTGAPLVIIGSFLLGSTMVLFPAMAQPFMRKVTGNDDIALGHFNSASYAVSSWIGEKVGKGSRSTEEMKLPDGLSFLRDNTISTAVTMSIIYIVLALVSGREYVTELSGGQHFLLFAIMQALMFTAGFTIVLAGVRMMLAEIIPAFKGIAQKIVPDAKPALDCPITFPYAPTAVIVGFLGSVVGGFIVFLILPLVGLPVIIPGMIPIFFTGAATGVLANAVGGRRGAIVGSVLNGAIITFLPAFLLPMLGDLGFQNTTFGDSDFGVIGILVGKLGDLMGSVGIYLLVAAVVAIFVAVSLPKGKKTDVAA